MKSDIWNIDTTHPSVFKTLQQFSLFTSAAGFPDLVDHNLPHGQIVPTPDTFKTFLDVP
jgi:hypothetical protein